MLKLYLVGHILLYVCPFIGWQGILIYYCGGIKLILCVLYSIPLTHSKGDCNTEFMLLTRQREHPQLFQHSLDYLPVEQVSCNTSSPSCSTRNNINVEIIEYNKVIKS